MAVELGRFGVWHGPQHFGPELAAGIERAGYGTLWLGASPDTGLRDAEVLLAATNSIAVGTSIVNMWKSPVAEVAASYHRLEDEHPGRFLLGVGIGHRELNNDYRSPYEVIVRYLDELDDAKVPEDRRALAALGPKVVHLAGTRTAGALPYLTTPEHTKEARRILGGGVLLAPEQMVVLETDPEIARATARDRLSSYLQLSNYTKSFERLGFGPDDLAGGGSDRLVDALVLHGSAVDVAAGLRAHLEAGADHVAIQQLGKEGMDLLPGYEALATVLGI
ncbi:TIGR03620 family F420-dependent LLM class oxidoreductase [Kribbella solani]|uniref:Putative F420-dependent oxidoreductase n=1 Tax=Kribbella solani TaxID=236067 RepID=A0A841DGU7_9ACTN|nr:putative F420-dependent oxidoreductase [Kribbella solani]